MAERNSRMKKIVLTSIIAALSLGALASCGGKGGTKQAAEGEKLTYWTPITSVATPCTTTGQTCLCTKRLWKTRA